jgi:hypothetical protein
MRCLPAIIASLALLQLMLDQKRGSTVGSRRSQRGSPVLHRPFLGTVGRECGNFSRIRSVLLEIPESMNPLVFLILNLAIGFYNVSTNS